jgi:hypothetical protein
MNGARGPRSLFISMRTVDLLILPLGCFACGLLSASSLLLRSVPALRVVVYALVPLKIPIGVLTALASALALLFPAHGPLLFGSLFPGLVGLLLGALFSLEAFMDTGPVRRWRGAVARWANAMVYLKHPLGLLALFLGVMHLLFPQALFF